MTDDNYLGVPEHMRGPSPIETEDIIHAHDGSVVQTVPGRGTQPMYFTHDEIDWVFEQLRERYVPTQDKGGIHGDSEVTRILVPWYEATRYWARRAGMPESLIEKLIKHDARTF